MISFHYLEKMESAPSFVRSAAGLLKFLSRIQFTGLLLEGFVGVEGAGVGGERDPVWCFYCLKHRFKNGCIKGETLRKFWLNLSMIIQAPMK